MNSKKPSAEQIAQRVDQELEDSCRAKQRFSNELKAQMGHVAQEMAAALERGGTIYWMGNGGSAADAQHLAAELVVTLHRKRRALAAIALTVNPSVVTAIANDIGFQEVFARQVEAFVQPGDVLIGISTSGNSDNVVRAVQKGNDKQALTVAWTGESGGRLAEVAQLCLRVPSKNTQRIQECHITIGHIICEIVEDLLQSENA